MIFTKSFALINLNNVPVHMIYLIFLCLFNFIVIFDRDEQPAAPTYGNIMTDRRVCRGPAFLHHPVPTVSTDLLNIFANNNISFGLV